MQILYQTVEKFSNDNVPLGTPLFIGLKFLGVGNFAMFPNFKSLLKFEVTYNGLPKKGKSVNIVFSYSVCRPY